MKWLVASMAIGIICTGLFLLSNDSVKLFAPLPSGAKTDKHNSSAVPQTRRIFAAGVIEGLNSPLELRFESSGKVIGVYVKPGDRVKANQILAELDPTSSELRISQAEAQLKIAMLERDQQSHDRLGSNATLAPTLDLANSRTRLVSKTTNDSSDIQSIAEARVVAAEAALKLEQLAREHQRLLAPIDGTVLTVNLQAGSVVNPISEQRLITLVNQSKTCVHAYVEELDALDVSVGQRATILVSGRPDVEYHGHVTHCAPTVEPKSHRHLNPGERIDVRVREIIVDVDQGEQLLVGLPVEVFLENRVAPAPSKRSGGANPVPHGRRKTIATPSPGKAG